MTTANRIRLTAAAAIAALFALGACTSMEGANPKPTPSDQNPAHQQHYSN